MIASIRIKSDQIVMGGLVTGLCLFIYWKILSYPFIQDDWCVISTVMHDGTWKFISSALDPSSMLFYRPFSLIYILITFRIFYLNPLGYHILALSIHIINSLLVVWIARTLKQNIILAWAAGIFYAGAISIHLDPLGWLVGISDVLGCFVFLLSLIFFLRGRKLLSACIYLAALLTKESTITLPFILLFYTLLFKDNEIRFRLDEYKSAFIKLRYHFAVLILYVIFTGVRFLNLGTQTSGETYEMSFWGIHLINNLYTYYKWCCQLFYPIYKIDWTDWFVPTVTVIAALIIIKYRNKMKKSGFIFYVNWFFIGIIPALVLTHHSYRYYLIYSLPPFYFIFVQVLWSIVREDRTKFILLTAVILIVNAFLAQDFTSGTNAEGINLTGLEGSNDLPMKGAIIKMVREYIGVNQQMLPDHSVYIFDGLPTEIFCGSAGPRLWSGDTTLRVFDSRDVDIDSLGVHTSNIKNIEYFKPEKVMIFTFRDGSLSSTRLSP